MGLTYALVGKKLCELLLVDVRNTKGTEGEIQQDPWDVFDMWVENRRDLQAVVVKKD